MRCRGGRLTRRWTYLRKKRRRRIGDRYPAQQRQGDPREAYRNGRLRVVAYAGKIVRKRCKGQSDTNACDDARPYQVGDRLHDCLRCCLPNCPWAHWKKHESTPHCSRSSKHILWIQNPTSVCRTGWSASLLVGSSNPLSLLPCSQ